MLASLLGQHDRFLLHAAAIVRETDATLILGGSGTGKSTLTFGAIENGWRALSDDLVVVRAGPDGPIAWGIPKPLTVPEDVLGAVSGRPLIGDPRGRHQVHGVAWARGWHKVTAIAVTAHGPDAEARLEPLPSQRIMEELFSAALCRQPKTLRAYVRTAMRLSALPSRRLLHARAAPDRPRSAAAAVEALN